MYQNKVTLIGFLGSNAEVRNNGNFTTPSLPRTPSRLRRAPQRFCQSELQCRHAHSHRSILGCFWQQVSDGFHGQKADIRAPASASSQARQWKMRVLGGVKQVAEREGFYYQRLAQVPTNTTLRR
jgi:hypothetical protein